MSVFEVGFQTGDRRKKSVVEHDEGFVERREGERRAHQRMPAALGARIELLDMGTTYDCKIVNISKGGALIEMDNAAILPAEFRLSIPAKGLRKTVVVRWRGDHNVGVEFTNDELSNLAERVLVLEQELKLLKAYINSKEM